MVLLTFVCKVGTWCWHAVCPTLVLDLRRRAGSSRSRSPAQFEAEPSKPKDWSANNGRRDAAIHHLRDQRLQLKLQYERRGFLVALGREFGHSLADVSF